MVMNHHIYASACYLQLRLTPRETLPIFLTKLYVALRPRRQPKQPVAVALHNLRPQLARLHALLAQRPLVLLMIMNMP